MAGPAGKDNPSHGPEYREAHPPRAPRAPPAPQAPPKLRIKAQASASTGCTDNRA
ncbi:hypothetical protein ROR02_26510 [Pararhodospirillum oryzae]|uniref:Uncharacterized protein n=1 Tax=Pararhodospirillum oryzae TaxID=478448 RepID=A0A512HAV7_9PROT|nr:hypothetical protein ROR02_26510 [Pararhodospirillum oryzae]